MTKNDVVRRALSLHPLGYVLIGFVIAIPVMAVAQPPYSDLQPTAVVDANKLKGHFTDLDSRLKNVAPRFVVVNSARVDLPSGPELHHTHMANNKVYVTADCHPDYIPISGGCQGEATVEGRAVVVTSSVLGNGWTCQYQNTSGLKAVVMTSVVCAKRAW